MARYEVILIDAPWVYTMYSEKSKTRGRRASHHYRLQDWQWLGELGPHIRSVAAPHCAIFVWVTPPLLPWQMRICGEGFEGDRLNGLRTGPFKGWGLRYITEAFIW